MRGFTDAERTRIEREIRAAGRELFARLGPRRTTIADLVEPAGVAPSTFYQFYDSKEALYRSLLETDGTAVAESIAAESFGATEDPERALRWFLYRVTEEIENNPLVRRVLVEDALAGVHAPADHGPASASAFLVPFVEAWVAEGRLRGPDAETVAGALRAAMFVTCHRETLGDSYPAVRDLLLESVAAGLVVD